MKSLNDMTDDEIDKYIKEEKLRGTDIEKLLDYVKNTKFDSLYRKVNLYQFIRSVYRTQEDTMKTDIIVPEKQIITMTGVQDVPSARQFAHWQAMEDIENMRF